jgi:Zn-dependent protease with chaperone function
VGDVSSLLATVPTFIMQAKYSRDMEREADVYAEQTLNANGLSPCLLGTILDKMEASYREKMAEKRGQRDAGEENDAMEYLSSHPATGERMRMMCPG